jgi:hypothetical protein
MTKKVNYTLEKDNTITGYTIFPFDENQPWIEIETDDFRPGKSKIIDGVFYSFKEEADAISAKYAELAEIENWLSANDYKILKFVVGEWTATTTKWINYLKERKVKRARQNELQEELGITYE